MLDRTLGYELRNLVGSPDSSRELVKAFAFSTSQFFHPQSKTFGLDQGKQTCHLPPLSEHMISCPWAILTAVL